MIVLIVVYSVCVFLLIYHYLIYGVLVKLWAKMSYTAPIEDSPIVFSQLPEVNVLMAAFNEEKVLEEKINSLIETDYPKEKLRIFIGSDNSTDATNTILETFAKKYPYIFPIFFTQRQGKPAIINHLALQAKTDNTSIFIITDANVFFTTATITELVKHFRNPAIALVDSNIQNTGIRQKGISQTEQTYISGEINLKQAEGQAFQYIAGPMGGCYAIRSDYFSPIPTHHLVDDFYVAMCAYEKGGKAIVEPKAICYEDVSHHITDEIRRKKRIATGCFQNLARFRKIIFNTTTLSFILISHKVLRWWGFVFILLSWLSAGLLAPKNHFFLILFSLESIFLFLVPLFYFLLIKINIHIHIFRTITYFNATNYAFLLGFIQYQKGVQSGIWQPTKRNK